MKSENELFYQDILPQNYGKSFANPAFAVQELGEEFGRILSFLYTELRSERAFVFEQNLEKITILNELFLEIYCMFEDETVSYKQIKDTIYWFLYDYADDWAGYRVRELVDAALDFATSIIMDSDLGDLRYLYSYGDYISEVELKTAEFLNGLSDEEIEQIAATFTEGYQRGFELKGVDVSKKDTVNIRYPIGFERVIRAAIRQFAAMGLKPVIYREALNTLNKRQNLRIGYISSDPNPQYGYDHRFDNAIYLDKRMVDRKISCMRKAYEEYEQEAAGFAGPACFEVFGEEPFEPVNKPESYRLSERQQSLSVEYSSLSNELLNEFINQEERSFTIIAYPVPSIGEKFPEIFEEIRKVNTLDNELYKGIQQNIINILDQAESVHIMGRGRNMTNLTVALCDLKDAQKETKFENCLADVNIPVGECAIGTNTTAYVMAAKYGIMEKLPILIAEKMGPHIAIGDTCYSYCEDVRVYNPDGKEIVAKENECAAFRKEDPKKAYFNCHTDITIPYEELSRIAAVTAQTVEVPIMNDVAEERVEIPILLDGRFVLEGTLKLNEPFEGK